MYIRLILQAFFNGKNSRMRMTPKRLFLMIGVLPVFLMLQIIHRIAFFLDDVLFPEYRKIEIKKPLFIVGLPRSGTTFLQRLLAQDESYFTTISLWELLLAPSVLERKIIFAMAGLDKRLGAPVSCIISRAEKKALRRIHKIQTISMYAPWEDYFLLFPVCACFLLVLFFPFSEELWHLAYFDDQASSIDKNRLMEFYRSCLQKHLLVHGEDKRILSKNPSFTAMINALTTTFPDCRIIACMRNPLHAVPSLINTMIMGAKCFGNDMQGDEFRDRLVDMLHYFSHHLIQTLPRLPGQNHIFVTMEALTENVDQQVRRIYRRFGYSLCPSFETMLQRECLKSKDYRSHHDYSLRQFDLKPEDITNKFKTVFEIFGYRI